MTRTNSKALVLRLSSIGDIIQALEVPSVLKKSLGFETVDWVVREDLAPLLALQPAINRTWCLSRKASAFAIFALGLRLRREGYTHLYDAHSSLRSQLLRLAFWGSGVRILVRGKQRVRRFLFFKLGIRRWRGNLLLEQPYRARQSFLTPLRAWNAPPDALLPRVSGGLVRPSAWAEPPNSSESIPVLVPGSAWPKKNWPVARWIDLLKEIQQNQNTVEVAVLGGVSDTICDSICEEAKKKGIRIRIQNLRGKCSLAESIAWIAQAPWVVAVDTGWMHLADQFGIKTVAILGPTAFGYPSGSQSRVARLVPALACQPCSKDGSGPCSQSVYQLCLAQLSAKEVLDPQFFHP